MLLTKAELELGKFADKQASRYAIGSIGVDSEYTIATDGHTMVAVKHDGYEVADFPAIEGLTPASPNGEPILIEAKAALTAAKALPKTKSALRSLQHAALGQSSKLYVSDGHNTQTFGLPQEGRFPNWKAVWPQNNPKAVVLLDAAKLRALAEYFAKVGKDVAEVKIEVFDKNTAVQFTGQTADGQEVKALLMPRRLD
jgi:hypothetical protein